MFPNFLRRLFSNEGSGEKLRGEILPYGKTKGTVCEGNDSRLAGYGVCSSAANVAGKGVECAGFCLERGARIVVLFAVGNTAGAPTLDVGNTGPKPIRYRNAVISSEILAAGRTYAFIYDGEAYELIGDVNTDTGTTYEVGTGLELSGATLSVKYGNSAGTSCQGNDTRLSGGEDWSKSKKDIVDRITSLESGGGVEAGDGLDKSGKTLSVKYGNGKGTALEGDGTAANAKKWNGSSLTISSAAPSGGSDADIWLTWI